MEAADIARKRWFIPVSIALTLLKRPQWIVRPRMLLSIARTQRILMLREAARDQSDSR